jgi:hypothetical protein
MVIVSDRVAARDDVAPSHAHQHPCLDLASGKSAAANDRSRIVGGLEQAGDDVRRPVGDRRGGPFTLHGPGELLGDAGDADRQPVLVARVPAQGEDGFPFVTGHADRGEVAGDVLQARHALAGLPVRDHGVGDAEAAGDLAHADFGRFARLAKRSSECPGAGRATGFGHATTLVDRRLRTVPRPVGCIMVATIAYWSRPHDFVPGGPNCTPEGWRG